MGDTAHLDIDYVAELARIDLTPEEARLFQTQLDQVLHYVEQLSVLDVSGVEPTAHAMDVVNVLREDSPRPSMDRDEALKNAPASRDGQILVPKIIDNG